MDVRETEESGITSNSWARVVERMLFPLPEMGKTISDTEEIGRKSEVEFEICTSHPNRNAE